MTTPAEINSPSLSMKVIGSLLMLLLFVSAAELILRVVDPEYETPAADAFASKHLLHEPFMGGGLWTSTAIPLLALWGGWPVFAVAAGAMTFWFIVVFGSRAMRRA